jgi:hypothetical protein
MKKKTKEWIKSKLISFLDENKLTIISSSWGSKKGIGERPSYYKSHFDDYVEEYLTTKFHLQCEENKSKLFFEYLLNNKQGNEDILLEFFKNKSPTNKTKIEKNGHLKVEDSSNEHYEYQKYMTELLKDQDMLFDYIGNLRFLGGEQEISFELIENVFDKQKKETLIEMYLNSNLIKNTEFERKFYQLLERTNLKDKYVEFLPNLKEGKKDFSLDQYEHKKTDSFIVSFDKDILVQQVETNKSLHNIFKNIENIVNLKKIKELNIEDLFVLNKVNERVVIVLGDSLNIDYIKIAITEYMRISLKEESKSSPLNSIVEANTDFDTDKGSWNNIYKEGFVDFKERIQKLYLKEKLNQNLVKEEIIKTKPKKI